MNTKCLLAPPAQEICRACVPERDDAVRIQSDQRMFGQSVESQTKNGLRDTSTVLVWVLSRDTFAVGGRAV